MKTPTLLVMLKQWLYHGPQRTQDSKVLSLTAQIWSQISGNWILSSSPSHQIDVGKLTKFPYWWSLMGGLMWDQEWASPRPHSPFVPGCLSKDPWQYLFYFPTSSAKTAGTLVTVRLDIPVLHVDTLGILLWELRLQLVGEVMKNAHTVLCGLREEHDSCSHSQWHPSQKPCLPQG